ncbi:TPD1 protein-like 1 [Spatholobus suberectus]|nr:TPD1 protein-like 1 [Spatholobus suberectus]
MFFSRGNRTVITCRKLLQSVDDGDTNRIGMACSKVDIVIYQGQVPPLPSGIPAYRVQIMNMCASDCNIANIRLHCGWFSSARLINPRVFRRLGYDDCLVNDGQALGPGKTISFEYANTYRYPLSVSSVVCS